MSTHPKSIQVPVVVSKRKEYWIAYCPVLKTFGYSNKNKEAALDDFDSAITTFFHVQNTLGTLNQTLLSLGWTRSNNAVQAPKKYQNFDFPISKSVTSDNVVRDIRVPA